jgi:hypothetical protein
VKREGGEKKTPRMHPRGAGFDQYKKATNIFINKENKFIEAKQRM